jgi:hypothetical protein
MIKRSRVLSVRQGMQRKKRLNVKNKKFNRQISRNVGTVKKE